VLVVGNLLVALSLSSVAEPMNSVGSHHPATDTGTLAGQPMLVPGSHYADAEEPVAGRTAPKVGFFGA